jgi:hypothetical protein
MQVVERTLSQSSPAKMAGLNLAREDLIGDNESPGGVQPCSCWTVTKTSLINEHHIPPASRLR